MEVSPQALPLSWTFLPNIGHAASSLSSPGDQHSGALVWTFFPVVRRHSAVLVGSPGTPVLEFLRVRFTECLGRSLWLSRSPFRGHLAAAQAEGQEKMVFFSSSYSAATICNFCLPSLDYNTSNPDAHPLLDTENAYYERTRGVKANKIIFIIFPLTIVRVQCLFSIVLCLQKRFCLFFLFWFLRFPTSLLYDTRDFWLSLPLLLASIQLSPVCSLETLTNHSCL